MTHETTTAIAPEDTDYTVWWDAALRVARVSGEPCTTTAERFVGGVPPATFPRLYGGQLAGQSVSAAAATVEPAREVHSVQVSYLRSGDPGVPVDYTVERLRDSRTLSTRGVRAEQGGRLLATATVSFHDVASAGTGTALRHDRTGRPTVAAEGLPSRAERLAERFGDAVPAVAAPRWPVDTRYVDRAPWDPIGPATSREPRNRMWLRPHGQLPDVAAVHAAAVTFATDFPMFEPVLFPHDIDWALLTTGRTVYGASLDHVLWFHRPPRFDDWLLLDQVSPVADRSRGFCHAELRSVGGELVATVAQEIAFVSPRG
ncbi:MAG TPA: acyl-CoA thioesterase domain-containing protein [Pseudonocardia sp.]|nr:acyl-CoA thioesterase domain-containing protein [Pseudonocardia sp.]